jgi:hypothetical protein
LQVQTSQKNTELSGLGRGSWFEFMVVGTAISEILVAFFVEAYFVLAGGEL